MLRTLKTLPLTLALAAVSVVTTSCGSTNRAQVRVINAIPDSGPTDIWVSGTRVASSLPFGAVFPTPAATATYLGVASGLDTIEGFEPGDTTGPISPIGTATLNGSTEYTVVAVGLELNDSPPLVLTDDNLAPTAGNLEFRIVNASLSSPSNGVDVYIVPPGTNITNYTPQITALGSGQGSGYQPVPFIAGGYEVVVTANLKKIPLIPAQPSAAPSGSITTMVLIDNPTLNGGNNGMSQTPLVLNDVN
jgi:hypothetical protein